MNVVQIVAIIGWILLMAHVIPFTGLWVGGLGLLTLLSGEVNLNIR